MIRKVWKPLSEITLKCLLEKGHKVCLETHLPCFSRASDPVISCSGCISEFPGDSTVRNLCGGLYSLLTESEYPVEGLTNPYFWLAVRRCTGRYGGLCQHIIAGFRFQSVWKVVPWHLPAPCFCLLGILSSVGFPGCLCFPCTWLVRG